MYSPVSATHSRSFNAGRWIPFLFAGLFWFSSCSSEKREASAPPPKKTAEELQTMTEKSLQLIYAHGDKTLRLDSALQLLNEVIRQDSLKKVAYDLKVTAQVMNEQPREAIATLNEWIDAHPKEYDLVLKRGLFYHRLQEPERAVKDFIEVKTKMEKVPLPHIDASLSEEHRGQVISRAMVYYLIGDVPKASELLNALHHAFPKDEKIAKAARELPFKDREQHIFSIVGF